MCRIVDHFCTRIWACARLFSTDFWSSVYHHCQDAAMQYTWYVLALWGHIRVGPYTGTASWIHVWRGSLILYIFAQYLFPNIQDIQGNLACTGWNYAQCWIGLMMPEGYFVQMLALACGTSSIVNVVSFADPYSKLWAKGKRCHGWLKSNFGAGACT